MPRCNCGETENIVLLDKYLEDIGSDVVCEGCETLVCLECGQDVSNEESKWDRKIHDDTDCEEEINA